MSSRRSRSGGTSMMKAPSRKIQIFAKRSRRDRRTQIAIGRGHDAGIDLDVALTADAPDLPLLQGPEQLGLNRRRDFADFIEKDRSVAGDFEEPCLVAHCTRERAAHVPEQLRFEQRLGEGCTVDADERRGGPRALIVNQADDELLARAALAIDQYRRVERCNARRHLEDMLHGCAACDEVPGRGMPVYALPKQVELAFAPVE